jgi:hypothetical protein
MLGSAAPYVVAVSMLLFCAVSALVWVNTVDHLDPPDTAGSSKHVH